MAALPNIEVVFGANGNAPGSVLQTVEGIQVWVTADRGNFANGAVTRLFPDFATCVWEAHACAPLIATGPALAAVRRVVGERARVRPACAEAAASG